MQLQIHIEQNVNTTCKFCGTKVLMLKAPHARGPEKVFSFIRVIESDNRQSGLEKTRERQRQSIPSQLSLLVFSHPSFHPSTSAPLLLLFLHLRIFHPKDGMAVVT